MTKYKNLDFLGFPDYWVGDDGTIWSRRFRGKGGKTGRKSERHLVKPNRSGGPKRYSPSVTLTNDAGVSKGIGVHHLVLFAFVGPRPVGYECRHFPDRDTFNCRLSNLSWASRKVNQRDRVVHGTSSRGELSGKCKLSVGAVVAIRTEKPEGMSIVEWNRLSSQKFGVCESYAEKVFRGTVRLWG